MKEQKLRKLIREAIQNKLFEYEDEELSGLNIIGGEDDFEDIDDVDVSPPEVDEEDDIVNRLMAAIISGKSEIYSEAALKRIEALRKSNHDTFKKLTDSLINIYQSEEQNVKNNIFHFFLAFFMNNSTFVSGLINSSGLKTYDANWEEKQEIVKELIIDPTTVKQPGLERVLSKYQPKDKKTIWDAFAYHMVNFVIRPYLVKHSKEKIRDISIDQPVGGGDEGETRTLGSQLTGSDIATKRKTSKGASIYFGKKEAGEKHEKAYEILQNLGNPKLIKVFDFIYNKYNSWFDLLDDTSKWNWVNFEDTGKAVLLKWIIAPSIKPLKGFKFAEQSKSWDELFKRELITSLKIEGKKITGISNPERFMKYYDQLNDAGKKILDYIAGRSNELGLWATYAVEALQSAGLEEKLVAKLIKKMEDGLRGPTMAAFERVFSGKEDLSFKDIVRDYNSVQKQKKKENEEENLQEGPQSLFPDGFEFTVDDVLSGDELEESTTSLFPDGFEFTADDVLSYEDSNLMKEEVSRWKKLAGLL